MVDSKGMKTDELQGYHPYGHPRPCAGDLKQPEGVNRCQKVLICMGEARAKERNSTLLRRHPREPGFVEARGGDPGRSKGNVIV
ncbi:hypothetical protein IM40_01275 [Candidatus Paracaedimonas acanthamoebae]|nr:hypothetical protein IM40_01275 [Candidatus Paracaedimonas acanthamoebae]